MNCGLTGEIGAGKTTALRFFTQLGADCWQSDDLAKDVLRQDPAVRAALVERWGSAVLSGPDGLNRSAVAAKIFSDAEERRWLEQMVHPRVRARWQECLSESHAPLRVVEIPLLFEKDLAGSFDFTVAIVAAPALTTERLRSRNWSDGEIARRRAAQWSREEKMKAAHIVLTNDGTLEHLRSQIELLWHLRTGR